MADAEALSQFMSITGCDAAKATQYLQFADSGVEDALELYYANNGADLATGGAADSTTGSSRRVIDVDDDGEGRAAAVDEDGAMAQRMQNDLYQDAGGGRDSGGLGMGDGIRAPMARTTETLVGPMSGMPESEEELRAEILSRLAARSNRRRGLIRWATIVQLSLLTI